MGKKQYGPEGCWTHPTGPDRTLLLQNRRAAAVDVTSTAHTRVPIVQAVPTIYAGIRFASTLEADWASTFDEFRWAWSYEPEAVKLPDGQLYRPDFWLPTMRVWAEVKGPHDRRIDKPRKLHRALDPDEWDVSRKIAIILRAPGSGGTAAWEAAEPTADIVVAACPDCEFFTFLDISGAWQCRRCYYGGGMKHNNKWWREQFYRSGELIMARAPRKAA